MVCYMKCLPNPIWRTGWLRFVNEASTRLRHVVADTSEDKDSEIKISQSFEQAKSRGAQLIF